MNSDTDILIENYGFYCIDVKAEELYEKNYGKKTLELLYIVICIEKELSKQSIPSHVLFQLIKKFLFAVKSEDPIAFHYDLSIRILEKEYEKKEIPSQSKDLLSRELCNALNELGNKIFSIPWMQKDEETLNQIAKKDGLGDSFLNIIETNNPDADKECFNDGKIFKPTDVYLKYLESTGVNGKERAKKIKEIIEGKDDEFWFEKNAKKKGEHFFHSSAFLSLAKMLWEDKIKKRITFDRKFPPCTAKTSFQMISSITSANKATSANPDVFNLVKGIDIVGTFDTRPHLFGVPTIRERVLQGIGKLNSVIGHKFIRYAVSTPFEQKLRGIEDYRVRQYDGGFSELGEEMGLSNKRDLAALREVVYALRHLDIPKLEKSKTTKGTLIDVAHFRSQKTSREDGLIITVLPTLVSYGEVDCSGKLLIPMATLPPSVKGIAPNQYHSSLYYLQMILIEEFSEKSKDFHQYGYIKINSEDWERFLVKANIPLKYKDTIISGWSENRDAPNVIEIVGKDHYRLGESYEKISYFLKDQGEFRMKRSLEGKILAQKKALKLKR